MNIPDLRFRGFEDEWEERVFSEVFDFSVPNNTLSRADLDDEPGSVRNIHYGDILTKYESCVDVSAERIPYIKNATCSEYNNQFLEDGDVVISDTAEDQAVGKAVEVTNVRDQYVTAGLHTIACRPFRETPPGYWGYYLNSDSFHSQLLPLMQGIKVLSINKTNLSKTNVKFPTNYQAQELIGAFFYSLDSFLQFHTRRQTKLLNLKRALLDKMFPKDGNDVPEIRFVGFDGAWGNFTLGDLGSVAMNRRIFKYQTSEQGEIPFYKIGTFGSEADAYISRELFEEYKRKYPYPKIGDILISAAGSIGKTVEYKGEDAYFQDSNIVWLAHDSRLDSKFLKAFYSVVSWAGLEGSTIKRLYNKNILETSISLPTLAEQQTIGRFFSHLDTLISLESQKLSKLRQLKKALLKRMFV